MSISVRLVGGLGNILFMTATLEYLGRRFGYETCYPNFKEHMKFLSGDFYDYNLHTEDLPLLFKNFNWKVDEEVDFKPSHIRRFPFHYDHITYLEDNSQ